MSSTASGPTADAQQQQEKQESQEQQITQVTDSLDALKTSSSSIPASDPNNPSWADDIPSKTFDFDHPSTMSANEEDSLQKRSLIYEKFDAEIQVQLADKQADPNSPLFSAKTFEELGLSENLLKGIYAMKFTKPSKIQERALPLLLKTPYTNMIAQSQSGTGKTAAFTLTMLSRMDFDSKTPQAICVAPARELATQIVDVVKEMGQYTPVDVCLAVKDMARSQKINSILLSVLLEPSLI